MKTAWIVLATFAVTVVGVLPVLNLTIGEKKIEQQVQRKYPAEDPQFRRALSALLGPQVLDGNRVEVLLNGDEIFPAMLQAIRQAQRAVAFETWIYGSESIGRAFADALSERARAGVQAARYHEPKWWNPGRLNNRTHRKVLVVDGHPASQGSTNLDSCSYRLDDGAKLRVLHEDSTRQQVAVFDDDWKLSRPITLQKRHDRPWRAQAFEHVSSLFGGPL